MLALFDHLDTAHFFVKQASQIKATLAALVILLGKSSVRGSHFFEVLDWSFQTLLRLVVVHSSR
jgi:hypothetical protein